MKANTMKAPLAGGYCFISLRIFLATGVFDTVAAFPSQRLLLKSSRQRIRPAVKNRHALWTGTSQKSKLKEEYESTALTSLSPSSALRAIPPIFGTIEYRDLLYDSTSIAFDAWEWTANTGAPSALVAAAVLVTLSETRLETIPKRQDKRWVRFTKRLRRFLLLTSFAFELASIFVAYLAGNMLLGHGVQTTAKKLVGYTFPLQLLYHHHELEYLITQISFLQGLIHWLGSVVCELVLPLPTETTSAKRMNKCCASWLITFIFCILAFYNDHILFYSDYVAMIRRLLVLSLFRKRKFRPMQLLYVPSFLTSVILTWRAFTSPPEED